jgi:hypothetical protein
MRCAYCKNGQTDVFRTQFFAARHIVTAFARSVRCASGRRRNPSVGKAWTGSGPVRPRAEKDGAVDECQPYVGSARWSPVKRISN